jgi:hypothetical protein
VKFDESVLAAASALVQAGTSLTYSALSASLRAPYHLVHAAVARMKASGQWPHCVQKQKPGQRRPLSAGETRNETVEAPCLPRVLDLDAATTAADRIRAAVSELSLADRLRVMKALAAYVESELPALEEYLKKGPTDEGERKAADRAGEAEAGLPAVRAAGA